MARVPLISLTVSTTLRWLAEAYHVNRFGSGCCWLLKVSRKGRVELRRDRCGLVAWSDLIIIMVDRPTSLHRLVETYKVILFKSNSVESKVVLLRDFL
jgi:hypothetical protein